MARKAGGVPFKDRGYDWEGIERAYRSGVQSNRQISADFGASEAAIRKRAKDEGWIRGEPHAVRALAYEKAAAIDVPEYVPDGPERIEALANVGASVLVRHRKQAAALQSLVQDMAVQLHDQTHNEIDLAGQIEEFYMAKAQRAPLLAAQYKQQCNQALQAISLGARSKTLLQLSNAMGKLVEIERKSWSLDDEDDKRSYEDVLAEIAAKARKKDTNRSASNGRE